MIRFLIAFSVVILSATASHWVPDDGAFFTCSSKSSWSPSCTASALLKAKNDPPKRSRYLVPRPNHEALKPTYTEAIDPTSTSTLSQRVEELGFVVIPSFVSPAVCKDAELHLMALIGGRDKEHLYESSRRVDIPIHNDTALELFQAHVLPRIEYFIKDVFGSLDNTVIDALASVSLFTGYDEQHAEAFTQQNPTSPNDVPMITLFVPLQDTRKDMAPLTAWARTHDSFTATPKSFQDQYLKEIEGVAVGSQPIGSLVILHGKTVQKFVSSRYDHKIHHGVFMTIRKGPSTSPRSEYISESLKNRNDLHPSLEGLSVEAFLSFVPPTKPKPKISKKHLTPEEKIDLEVEQGYYKYYKDYEEM